MSLTLYLEAKTTIPDLFSDYIEVRLASGESASLNWDESEIYRNPNAVSYTHLLPAMLPVNNKKSGATDERAENASGAAYSQNEWVRKFLVRLKRIFGYGISKFGKNKFQHTPYI